MLKLIKISFELCPPLHYLRLRLSVFRATCHVFIENRHLAEQVETCLNLSSHDD